MSEQPFRVRVWFIASKPDIAEALKGKIYHSPNDAAEDVPYRAGNLFAIHSALVTVEAECHAD